jgi:hypothetical protein
MPGSQQTHSIAHPSPLGPAKPSVGVPSVGRVARFPPGGIVRPFINLWSPMRSSFHVAVRYYTPECCCHIARWIPRWARLQYDRLGFHWRHDWPERLGAIHAALLLRAIEVSRKGCEAIRRCRHLAGLRWGVSAVLGEWSYRTTPPASFAPNGSRAFCITPRLVHSVLRAYGVVPIVASSDWGLDANCHSHSAVRFA